MLTQRNFWQTPVEFIKGIGPERAKLLKEELGISTYYDLFSHFPYRYIDRSRFYKTTEIKDDSTYFQLKGTLVSLRAEGSRFAKKLTGVFSDGYGKVELIWFNRINWIEKLIQPGREYILFGKPGLYKKKFSFIHPELTPVDEHTSVTFSSFMPFYHTTEKMKEKGMDSRAIARFMMALREKIHQPVPEILPQKIISFNKLFGRHEAFLNIHFPKGDESLTKARFRLKFEELFLLQLELLAMKQARVEKKNGFDFPVVGEKFNTYYKEKLPFKLTEAQKRVIKEIRRDTVSGFQMNRLLQGDVGSGKTIVALLSLL